MTRGRWIILTLLIILAAIITQMFREKRAEFARVEPSVSKSAEAKPATQRSYRKAIQRFDQTPDALAGPNAEKNGNHLQLFVQDVDGQPLAEVRVLSRIRAEKTEVALTNFNADFMTDVNGLTDVLWPTEKFKQLELTVSKTNYSSRKIIWDIGAGDTIPPTYVIKLQRGFTIGGTVVDLEGKPISDATVSVSRSSLSSDGVPPKKGEQSPFSTQKEITDLKGRWSVNNLPPELLDRISVKAEKNQFHHRTRFLSKQDAGERIACWNAQIRVEAGP